LIGKARESKREKERGTYERKRAERKGEETKMKIDIEESLVWIVLLPLCDLV
jgi:hypothetical protein